MRIYVTVGVYKNGSRKHNGVCPEDLQSHIEYNKKWRFGRALFVDGKCVHKGYLTDEEVVAVEVDLAENPPNITRCTAPYH